MVEVWEMTCRQPLPPSPAGCEPESRSPDVGNGGAPSQERAKSVLLQKKLALFRSRLIQAGSGRCVGREFYHKKREKKKQHVTVGWNTIC